MNGPKYEEAEGFDGAYRVAGWRGIAWHVLGNEVQPDEDTEWTGIMQPTGALVLCMVGDDRLFTFDPWEVEAIADEDYCGGCGQIGCKADAR
jgi:hypothetical protein